VEDVSVQPSAYYISIAISLWWIWMAPKTVLEVQHNLQWRNKNTADFFVKENKGSQKNGLNTSGKCMTLEYLKLYKNTDP
jgi:hypothetical protein